jgi:hypothetical protein
VRLWTLQLVILAFGAAVAGGVVIIASPSTKVRQACAAPMQDDMGRRICADFGR